MLCIIKYIKFWICYFYLEFLLSSAAMLFRRWFVFYLLRRCFYDDDVLLHCNYSLFFSINVLGPIRIGWPLHELRQLDQVVSLDFPTYYYYHYLFYSYFHSYHPLRSCRVVSVLFFILFIIVVLFLLFYYDVDDDVDLFYGDDYYFNITTIKCRWWCFTTFTILILRLLIVVDDGDDVAYFVLLFVFLFFFVFKIWASRRLILVYL